MVAACCPIGNYMQPENRLMIGVHGIDSTHLVVPSHSPMSSDTRNQRTSPGVIAAKSEAECFDRLRKELGELGDRDATQVTAQASENSPSALQTNPDDAARRPGHHFTSTNILIARTIRTAMAGIQPPTR
ncbi:hypothetical protein B0I35DRAFT_263684 [Stachybotrys elegans]|uniref:Uncharacterized protein n=1 Tax=Stachybotrys elegans TaxID=80388 RepID=A0A8K0STB6_9HYPO|nr:hypothetical protein B0I35DRAFT_263684 [Stachybotrys elegans]